MSNWSFIIYIIYKLFYLIITKYIYDRWSEIYLFNPKKEQNISFKVCIPFYLFKTILFIINFTKKDNI